ncbi:hypothetical protein ACSVDE_11650 [Pseudalkalibacillus sp. Hm43]|uniref:hypothetical protein n=1 Tax=Pseudalkalibacillus sp. Hm43 TaxID=3450742 RepID=UPI003F42819C
MKTFWSLLFICFITLVSPYAIGQATSWVELKPEVVVERADVVVKGTYDFSSKPKTSTFIFGGYEFNINEIYKGETTNPEIVGIDAADVGWAEDFQNDGGEFLLLLEKVETADFLVPVAGPNGMIQVKNGQVEEFNQERNVFFQEYINSKPVVKSTTTSTVNQSHNANWFYISLIVVLIISAYLLIRKKRTQS